MLFAQNRLWASDPGVGWSRPAHGGTSGPRARGRGPRSAWRALPDLLGG